MYRRIPFSNLKKHHTYFLDSPIGTFYSYDENKTYALFCKEAKKELYILHLVHKEEPIYIKSIIPSIQQAMEQRALLFILKNITGDHFFSW
jgi:hypothetical protein